MLLAHIPCQVSITHLIDNDQTCIVLGMRVNDRRQLILEAVHQRGLLTMRGMIRKLLS